MEREPVDANRPFVAHLDPTKRDSLLILDLDVDPEWLCEGDIAVQVIPLTPEALDHVHRLLVPAIGRRAAADAMCALGLQAAR